MLLRIRTIHQTTSLRYIFFFIFIVIFIFITKKSSKYFKCPLCSIPIFSSTSMTFYNISNNTDDEKISIDDLSILCLHMAHRLENEQNLPQAPRLYSPSLNSTRLHRLPYRYSQWKSSPLLPRRITPCEHTLMMHLLMIIERVCRKHQITFMMCDGTLLGSWRHHDIIPWDDDLDIMIPIEERSRFSDAVEQMNETLIKLYLFKGKRKKEYYKIYFRDTPSAGESEWNFPFVDVFFYVSNKTHIWELFDDDSIMKVKYVFPLVMRPLGELWLPAPRKLHRIFESKHVNECKGHYWDHRIEDYQTEVSFDCNELKDIYPFVERSNGTNSIETLRTNDTIIHTVIYN